MAGLTSLIRRHALISFFALAYGLSWASFYVRGGPEIFTLGPILAAVSIAAVTEKVNGLRSLAARMLRWRVERRWLAAAFLVPIGIGLGSAALTSLLGAATPAAASPDGWHNPVVLFVSVVVTGDTLFEETGWRAFALPRFPADRSPLANTLVLGVLLAGWHLPIAWSESGARVPYLLGTIASAVVTNWIYYNGRESALLAWLYHTSANTVGQYFIPSVPDPNRVTYFWVLAAVNVVAAVTIVLVTGRNLRRRGQGVVGGS